MSDETTIKQYPFDLKAEATTAGYRISGHCYGEDPEQVVKDLVRLVSMGITEFETKRLPLAVNFMPKVGVAIAPAFRDPDVIRADPKWVKKK